ncbi:SAM-dependent methyltransferase [Halobacterium salinarum]|uniref:SAM-dependent methyltransferase n=1 Tax=Halobacterium salinarum TaxID=2242 RepID=UPI0025568676|nr:SAM-dependent methyltransferase [Halobacterium salinarum]MDL0124651.1 SAM-dependent methyltransferase [Halobacterium salinarum]
MYATPIGYADTRFETAADAPRQGVETPYAANVQVYESFRGGLVGLEPDDRVVVVWWADDADRDVLAVRGGDRGVFTTRSPARPNPVCITPCELLAVDAADGTLAIRGVDMAHGSPVLDLKPALD